MISSQIRRLTAIRWPPELSSSWNSAPAGVWEAANGYNPVILYVMIQSVLQIDVEVEEPETSENPTLS